jgi:thiamine biosynthesis lipoprotein
MRRRKARDMNEIIFRAMGSEIYCAVESDSARVAERLERVPAMFEAWEKTLSRFRADSELSQLNARTGETVRVSETLGRVLQLARRAEVWTNFLVTPLVLNALEAAGYARSFEQIQNALARSSQARNLPARGKEISHSARDDNPPREQRTQAHGLEMPAANQWHMNETTRTVLLTRGARLDLGGVAKGWAAEQTARYLGELGAAMVDAGGDMVFSAPPRDGVWRVGIENPFAPDDDALPMLHLTHGAVTTSGRDFRKWNWNGHAAHHLIDPRTNLPATTDVVTATIAAPSIFQAEVAAKVALILGSEQGMDWLNAQNDLGAFLILEDGTRRMARMEQYIR